MASNRLSAIDVDTAESIFAEIASLQKKVEGLRKKVVKLLPAKYGSDLWWEKEHEEAFEEIKRGDVYGPFENTDELIKSLHKESTKIK